mmetsp:Transcript_50034/g.128780  ORF Transcript_50034/g.128780 Transcript_50034/m.128780 type:complete len:220 (+) Transcript_50034:2879-3538(+)
MLCSESTALPSPLCRGASRGPSWAPFEGTLSPPYFRVGRGWSRSTSSPSPRFHLLSCWEGARSKIPPFLESRLFETPALLRCSPACRRLAALWTILRSFVFPFSIGSSPLSPPLFHFPACCYLQLSQPACLCPLPLCGKTGRSHTKDGHTAHPPSLYLPSHLPFFLSPLLLSLQCCSCLPSSLHSQSRHGGQPPPSRPCPHRVEEWSLHLPTCPGGRRR